MNISLAYLEMVPMIWPTWKMSLWYNTCALESLLVRLGIDYDIDLKLLKILLAFYTVQFKLLHHYNVVGILCVISYM